MRDSDDTADPPVGYKKSPEDENKRMVDEPAAEAANAISSWTFNNTIVLCGPEVREREYLAYL